MIQQLHELHVKISFHKFLTAQRVQEGTKEKNVLFCFAHSEVIDESAVPALIVKTEYLVLSF